MRASDANPFVFSRALAPGEAIERGEEVDDLLRVLTGGNNVTLYGPRRLGKTSLLAQLAASALDRRMLAVRVDLSDVLGPADVAARLEQAFRTLPGRTGR